VGRKTILWDTHEWIGMGRTLTDDDFTSGIEMSEYGVELAVTSYVTDNAGAVGVSYLSFDEDYYGPVELLAGAYELGDAAGEGTGAPLAPSRPREPDPKNYSVKKADIKRIEKQCAKQNSGTAAAIEKCIADRIAALEKIRPVTAQDRALITEQCNAQNQADAKCVQARIAALTKGKDDSYRNALAAYRDQMNDYRKDLAEYKIELEKYIEDLTEQAVRNHRNRYPAPAVVRVPQNSQLTVEAVEELWDWLVPGTGFPIFASSTCRQLTQTQKLDRVTVLEDQSGERVTIIMSPAPIGAEDVIEPGEFSAEPDIFEGVGYYGYEDDEADIFDGWPRETD